MSLLALIACLAISACGGDDSTSSTPDTTATETSGDGVAEAKKAIAPYIGQPSPFPVTEPLSERPKGANIAFIDCGTPVCALFWDLLQPAAQTMEVNLKRIKAGSAANTVSAAMDTVVAEKPDGVIAVAINPELWQRQLKELQDAGIPVATSGIVNAEEYGVKNPQYSKNESERDGKLLANYVAATRGTESDVVVYEIPELTFTGVITSSFQDELARVCPGCKSRKTQIPVAAVGNTAPNEIVSDLQAHPETTVAVFPSGETQAGLPAALQTAGIEIARISNTATPTTLQYLKEGKETASLGVDLPVLIWTTLDQVAREIAGQEQTGPEAEGLTVVQFLTQKDVTFDPAKGWTGYPDFAERFAELWTGEG